MSHRKSSSEVEDNRDIWSKNITHFEKSTIVRGRVELVVRPLYERNRIPLKKTHIWTFPVFGIKYQRHERKTKEHFNGS